MELGQVQVLFWVLILRMMRSIMSVLIASPNAIYLFTSIRSFSMFIPPSGIWQCLPSQAPRIIPRLHTPVPVPPLNHAMPDHPSSSPTVMTRCHTRYQNPIRATPGKQPSILPIFLRHRLRNKVCLQSPRKQTSRVPSHPAVQHPNVATKARYIQGTTRGTFPTPAANFSAHQPHFPPIRTIYVINPNLLRASPPNFENGSSKRLSSSASEIS